MPVLLRLFFFFALLAASATTSVLYNIDTVAGSDPANDGGIAALTELDDVRCVAIDGFGNVYYSEPSRNRVMRISTNGTLSVLAGAGRSGYAGDGGPADAALLNQPYGIAADASGVIYIADLQNARIRKVSTDGRIQTIAGGGTQSPATPGVVAADLMLKAPRNLALDGAGNLYVSDFADHRVFRIGLDQRVTLIAGTGNAGPAPETVVATSGQLSSPAGLFVDLSGVVYIADSSNHAIRRVAGGVMNRVNVASAPAFLNLPTSVVQDTAGNLFVASLGYDFAVRITPSGGALVVARGARDLAIDNSGFVYIASGQFVRKLSPQGNLSTLAGVSGQYRGDGTAATQALLYGPSDVAFDTAGMLYIADTWNHRVRKIVGGVISTIAGDGEPGSSGDGLTATAARLAGPQGVSVDTAGNIYVADTDNHRIRRIAATNGLIQTLAGTGVAGLNGEAKLAREAQLQSPTAVIVDADGNVFVSDTGNHRVRRLSKDGYLLTFAGALTQRGFSGDGGGAFTAQLDTPRGLALDAQGNLYIADSGNHRIRRISPKGIITTVAGNGKAGFSGDNGKATEASLNRPVAVAVDSSGALFISDAANNRIRRVDPDGTIQTVAGSEKGFTGDRGPALQARMEEPAGLAIDSSGNVYVADRMNHRIRKLNAAPANTVVPPPPPPPPPPPIEQTIEVKAIHGATLEVTPVVPGMLLSLQGPSIGPATPVSGSVNAAGSLETMLSDVQVRFDGKPAPLLYAQDNLINVQVPYSVAGHTSTLVEFVKSGVVRASATYAVTALAPGIYTSTGGSGLVTAFNEDNLLNATENGAAPGSTIIFFATGEGVTDPSNSEGRITEAPYPIPVAPVNVSVSGIAAEVVAVGCGVTGPGILQVTVRIPQAALSGVQPLVLSIGGISSGKSTFISVK